MPQQNSENMQSSGASSRPLSARTQLVPLFSAACFALSLLELAMPRPAFFLRFGFANLPILLSVNLLSTKDYFALAACKVAGQALISGTMFSYVFIFSICSTFASAITMKLLAKLMERGAVSAVGTSVAGALSANLAQALLAQALLGVNAKLVVRPLVLFGLATSTLFGIFAERFRKKSKAMAALAEGSFDVAIRSGKIAGNQGGHDGDCPDKKSAAMTIAAFSLVVALGLTKNAALVSIEFLLAAILLLAKGKRIAVAPFLAFSITMLALALFEPPSGRVLAAAFGFHLTTNPLVNALKRILKFEGTLFASRAMNFDSRLFRKLLPKTLVQALQIFSNAAKSCDFAKLKRKARKNGRKKASLAATLDETICKIDDFIFDVLEAKKQVPPDTIDMPKSMPKNKA